MSLLLKKQHRDEVNKASNVPLSIVSQATYKHIVFGFWWCRTWYGVPFEFEYSRKRNFLHRTKEAQRRWLMMTFTQAFLFCYLSTTIGLVYWRLGFERIISNRDVLSETLHGILLITLLMTLFSLTLNVGYFRRYSFCTFVNANLDYFIRLRDQFANQFASKWKNGCEELMFFVRFTSLMSPVFGILHFLQHPEQRIYLTSLVSRDSFLYLPVFLFNGFLLLAIQTSGWSAIMALCFPVLGCAFSFFSVVEELRPNKGLYRLRPAFRKPENLRIVTRVIQLVTIQINFVFKHLLLMEQHLVTGSGTMCAFAFIRFWDHLKYSARGVLLLAPVTAIGLWTTVLTISARAYTESEKSFNTWRNYSNWTAFEKRVMKKYRKSIRPIQLEFGGFYYIRPKKIMAFWNTLVWLIVRALLTLPDINHS